MAWASATPAPVRKVLVSAWLLGVLGALVAVPLMAALQIIVQEVPADRRALVAERRAALEQSSGQDLDTAVAPAVRGP